MMKNKSLLVLLSSLPVILNLGLVLLVISITNHYPTLPVVSCFAFGTTKQQYYRADGSNTNSNANANANANAILKTTTSREWHTPGYRRQRSLLLVPLYSSNSKEEVIESTATTSTLESDISTKLAHPHSPPPDENDGQQQQEDSTTTASPLPPISQFSEKLIDSLDLIPLVDSVARHTGTRRGRQALLGLVGIESEDNLGTDGRLLQYGNTEKSGGSSSLYMNSIKRRLMMMEKWNLGTNTNAVDDSSRAKQRQRQQESRAFISSIAKSAEEATKEYDLVQEATHILQQQNRIYNNNNTTPIITPTPPPLYGADSSVWDTTTIPETDYDSWIYEPVDEWVLEYILQAEQVIQMILKGKEWANSLQSQSSLSSLVLQGMNMIQGEQKLEDVLKDISGSVEIVRVRSLTDPGGRGSYSIQLSSSKFHVLRIHRERERELEEEMVKKSLSNFKKKSMNDDSLNEIRREIKATEQEIEQSLFISISKVLEEIEACLDIVARLDVIFAKAAFGITMNGKFPKIFSTASISNSEEQQIGSTNDYGSGDGCGGRIDVKQFVHPLLVLREQKLQYKNNMMEAKSTKSINNNNNEVVPVDLKLSSEQGQQVLVISGPNGGGKTLALKSFGIVVVLSKLGIPIPTASTNDNILSPSSNNNNDGTSPQVDFFNNILVSVGDQQSLLEGESTWMSKLNAYSSIIDQVVNNDISNDKDDDYKKTSLSSLVLLDEVDGGTDPTAGGAISQAVLEKLIEVPTCRVVATSHTPLLKVASYNNERFGCASVLLTSENQSSSSNENEHFQQMPSFELHYGSIGDSYSLGAATRCKPSFPQDVLTRAADLIISSSSSSMSSSSSTSLGNTNGSSDGGAKATDANESVTSSNLDSEYVQALKGSLEKQLSEISDAKQLAMQSADDIIQVRKAMISLAASYGSQLSFLEQRLESYYAKLKTENDLELIGDSLSELRLVKKTIKSNEQLLKEKGLKMVPDSYQLSDGESVFIVNVGGEYYDGMAATVISSLSLGQQPGKKLGPYDVAIIPSLSPWEDEMMMGAAAMATTDDDNYKQQQRPLILKRSQIAIWDYDSVWDDMGSMSGGYNDEPVIASTSIQDSSRRVEKVLSALKKTSTSITQAKTNNNNNIDDKSKRSSSFSSARARKAAAKKKNTKNKKKK